MSEPTRSEIDAVRLAIESADIVNVVADAHIYEWEARAAIQALDKVRGECVPVDKLRDAIGDVVNSTPYAITMAARLQAWLDRKGWLDK